MSSAQLNLTKYSQLASLVYIRIFVLPTLNVLHNAYCIVAYHGLGAYTVPPQLDWKTLHSQIRTMWVGLLRTEELVIVVDIVCDVLTQSIKNGIRAIRIDVRGLKKLTSATGVGKYIEADADL
jgi:hypothetical protein